MPNNADTMLTDLTTRLERLVAQAKKEGRADALAEVRQLVGGGGGTGSGKAAKKPAKRKKKRKNWWATATEKQKAERTRKMLAGRGLKPKSERKTTKKTRTRKPRKRKSSK